MIPAENDPKLLDRLGIDFWNPGYFLQLQDLLVDSEPLSLNRAFGADQDLCREQEFHTLWNLELPGQSRAPKA